MILTREQKAERSAHARRVNEARTTGNRQPLTDSQHAVLAAMARLYLATGRMPTYRETCDALGISSPNGLLAHLQALERKGYVRVNRVAPGKKVKARSVEIVGLAEAVTPAARTFLDDLLARAGEPSRSDAR